MTCMDYMDPDICCHFNSCLAGGQLYAPLTEPVAIPGRSLHRQERSKKWLKMFSSVGLSYLAFRHWILVKYELYSMFGATVVSQLQDACDQRSSLQGPPPKCSYFQRRGDNHEKCQQCRFKEGGHECTRETPCEVCKTCISENWDAHEKARKQKLKKAAASAAKKMQESSMDDSIDIHAPEDALCGQTEKSRKSDESTRHKSKSDKHSATGGRSNGVQSKVVHPPKSDGSSGRGTGSDSPWHRQRMNTGIGITTAVPETVDSPGTSRNVATRPDAIAAVIVSAQLQLRAGPARDTENGVQRIVRQLLPCLAIMIRRDSWDHRGRHVPNTMSVVQQRHRYPHHCLGTRHPAVVIQRVYQDQHSSHEPGTMGVVQRIHWRPHHCLDMGLLRLQIVPSRSEPKVLQ